MHFNESAHDFSPCTRGVSRRFYLALPLVLPLPLPQRWCCSCCCCCCSGQKSSRPGSWFWPWLGLGLEVGMGMGLGLWPGRDWLTAQCERGVEKENYNHFTDLLILRFHNLVS